jgi:hypothetical protein
MMLTVDDNCKGWMSGTSTKRVSTCVMDSVESESRQSA